MGVGGVAARIGKLFADRLGQGRISVRTKFLLMMLLTSLVSLATITYMAYHSGKAAITEAAVNQLTSIRAAKKLQVEYYFQSLRSSFRALADAPITVEALTELSDGFRQLGTTTLAPERRKAVEDYYARQFLPELQKNSDNAVRIEDLLPTRPAVQELQSLFIVENENKTGEKARLSRHHKELPYTRAHAIYHRWMLGVAERLKLADVFLIDEEGNVIYTAIKEPDLGQSVSVGPLAATGLGQLARDVARSRQPREARFADFTFYWPSSNAPAAFLAAPLFKGERFVGVLAAQISSDDIGNFMNDGGKWREQGLGETGAAYIVGADLMMRSNFRGLSETPEDFLRQIARLNLVSSATAQRIREQKTTVLRYPIRNAPIVKALQGQSGTELFVNQRGVGAFLSYAPLDIPDLNWVVVARMDEKEVLASQIRFNRNVMIAACSIALLITFAALGLAGLFLRPVKALLSGIERLRKGERGVEIKSRSRDEFNDLVTAFNGMSEAIKSRDEVIDGKTRAYEQLLRRIFPDVVADRMRRGEAGIVESYSQVTAVYVIIEGFTEIAQASKAEQAAKILSEIVDRIDGVADDTGVEKVKTVGDHYLAVSGLSVARLDSAHRAIQFTRLAWRELQQVNKAHGLGLGLRAGIATGPLQVGLVGSRRFVFDVWGYAASAARRIVYDSEINAVRLDAGALSQLTDKETIGEELIVRTKSLGPIQTFQLRLATADGKPAAEAGMEPVRTAS